MPILSIVIPNHDYGRYADRLFSSLAHQAGGLRDVEIIFVDDASSDDSVARAEEWSGRLDCARFAIERLSRQGHPGPVRNHGLSLAEGRYLFCLDPDDTLRPEFLARCLGALEADPALSGAYPDYFEITPEASRTVRLPAFNPGLLRMQNILPTTAVYRRELWDSGARYRDNTDYEDWDYWVQCVRLGARFRRVPEPLYDYRFHGDNFSYRAERHDGQAKAAIVLNNPGFFHPLVELWAKDLSRGRLYAQPFPRGCIPTPDDVQELLKTVEGKVLHASGF
jgi:glycosyltransferase involved in cell wall biosynthesis